MLRGENIVCGTSTTGTGTLTLAATPVAPGGIDFDVLARATGIGFGNSAAVLVSYTIIEYTDTTFATAKSTEKGIGTLTLGGSSGIANCTLARTTVQVTATNLNSQPATYNTNAPTAFSIGTAANVLVFVGASAADIPAWSPYYITAIGDNLGLQPTVAGQSAPSAQTVSPSNLSDGYYVFEWRAPMLVKKASVRVSTAYSGTTGTPISNAYARIYTIGTDGKPGKLLVDLGAFGSNCLNATGNISSGVHANGFFLHPGEYYFDMLLSYSGATGTVVTPKLLATAAGYQTASRMGCSNFNPFTTIQATSGTAGAAPDPANTTGLAGAAGLGQTLSFALNSS